MTRVQISIMTACRLLAVVCVATPSVLFAGPFEAGTATVEITPPVGYRMSGRFHERISAGTKDPLLAKAIVFSQGDVTAALVCCDIIEIDPRVAHESRRLIAVELGIAAENVSIAATHAHTSPLYWGALRDQFHKAAVAREGSDPQEVFDYLPLLGFVLRSTNVRNSFEIFGPTTVHHHFVL